MKDKGSLLSGFCRGQKCVDTGIAILQCTSQHFTITNSGRLASDQRLSSCLPESTPIAVIEADGFEEKVVPQVTSV